MMAVGASLLFSGCLPDQPDYIDDLDLVYTNYSQTFHFADQHTYSLPDNVVKISGDQPAGDSVQYVSAPYNNEILQDLRDNMNSNGWTEVASTDTPDVILLAAVNTTTNINYYYDSGYWGGYYPGYGSGWGWYYPGYYPAAVTTYKTGTLLVQMTYPSGIGANDQVPVQWLMLVDGLLGGSAQDQLQRIDTNISQGFKQSPYLKIK